MKFENLLCERSESVLTVTLNRPEKLNSLSMGLLRDLDACAESIQRDSTLRAVVLTGAGRGFCAGADLTDPEAAPLPGQTMGQRVASRMRGLFNPVALKWSQLPVPLVVAVNGVAAGAGGLSLYFFLLYYYQNLTLDLPFLPLLIYFPSSFLS